MTDEYCGAECADGSPCENLAGSCPHHGTDDPPENGRPSKFTEERAQAAIDAATESKSKAGCARAAGVGKATLERWLDTHADFRNAFAHARAEGESQLIEGGLHDPEVDSSMAKFLLASSFDYVKAEKRELEHSGEVDGLEFTINAGTED